MYVILTAHGNVDHGQDPNKQIAVKDIELIFTFAGASKACKDYIKENNLGAGNWSGGRIYDHAGGKQIAYVSYNGRVWDMNNNEIGG